MKIENKTYSFSQMNLNNKKHKKLAQLNLV